VFTHKKVVIIEKIEKSANRQLIAELTQTQKGLGYRSYLSTGPAVDDFVTRGAEDEPAPPAATSVGPWAHAKKYLRRKAEKMLGVRLLQKKIPAATQRG
jgi:hypothetical protein